MKLTKKIVLSIVVICLLFAGLFFVLFRLILTPPIQEQKYLRANTITTGALTVLQTETKRITSFCEDWAMWDTMYAFTTNPTPAVLRDLSPDLTVKYSDIGFLMIADKVKTPISMWAFRERDKKYIDFISMKQKKGPLWNFFQETFAAEETVTGIVGTEHGFLLTVSAPVLHSDDQGPPNGRVIMGCLLDRSFEERIAAVIGEKVSFIMPSQEKSGREKFSAPMQVTEMDRTISIDYLLKDAWDNPAFVIHVAARKRLFTLLEDSARLFFLLLIGGFLLLGSIIYFTVHRLVVQRVALISEQTDKIVSFDDLSLRVPEKYRDEITQLSRNINMMLQRLQKEKRQNEEYQDMMHLNEKLVFLGRVTSGIAHEINNPLFAIHNAFNMIKKHMPEGNEKLQNVVRMMTAEINRVRGITSNMQQYTYRQLESPTLSNLLTILDAAVNVLRWSKQLAGTRIRIRKDKAHYPLHCNPGSLQQVFMNIIVNAAQATSGQGTVDITIYREEDEYVIQFSDNGPGFDNNMKVVLFTPFQSTKAEGGSGLGLHISRNIVISHGGVLSLDHQYVGGARLVVRLPVKGGPENET